MFFVVLSWKICFKIQPVQKGVTALCREILSWKHLRRIFRLDVQCGDAKMGIASKEIDSFSDRVNFDAYLYIYLH